MTVRFAIGRDGPVCARRRMSSLSVIAVRRARWNHIPSKVYGLYSRNATRSEVVTCDHYVSEMILKQKIFEVRQPFTESASEGYDMIND